MTIAVSWEVYLSDIKTWLNVQIDDAHFWRRAYRISRFGSETHDPRARVVNINFGVARVNSGESDAVPSAKLGEVPDGHDGDPKHGRMTREK